MIYECYRYPRSGIVHLTWGAVPLATSTGWDKGEQFCLGILRFWLRDWQKRSVGGGGGLGREEPEVL